jgi:hypothetical protein
MLAVLGISPTRPIVSDALQQAIEQIDTLLHREHDAEYCSGLPPALISRLCALTGQSDLILLAQPVIQGLIHIAALLSRPFKPDFIPNIT